VSRQGGLRQSRRRRSCQLRDSPARSLSPFPLHVFRRAAVKGGCQGRIAVSVCCGCPRAAVGAEAATGGVRAGVLRQYRLAVTPPTTRPPAIRRMTVLPSIPWAGRVQEKDPFPGTNTNRRSPPGLKIIRAPYELNPMSCL
jgi:hypothetical protein